MGVQGHNAHTSKVSFQVGLSDRLKIAVVLVCSPSTVNTAKGSGKLSNSRLTRPLAPNTCRVEEMSENSENM